MSAPTKPGTGRSDSWPLSRTLWSAMCTGRMVAGLVVVALAASGGCDRYAGGEAPAPLMELSHCILPGGTVAQCGTLAVYEDRAARNGPMIDLSVAVVPAQDADQRLPDPIFYLAGGPGGAATDNASWYLGHLREANTRRDLVFVDQRGTGDSNELTCPVPPDPDHQVEQLRACLADLPGDPRAYTTAWAMDDLDDVRAALGYDTINLLGASYGVAAGQVYAQRYPDRTRTATLVMGTDIDVSIAERLPWASQRAFDLLVERCATDPACRAAYPDPPGDLAAVAAELARGPVELPQTVAGEPLVATREALGMWVHHQLTGTKRAGDLLWHLHAASQGDWQSLSHQLAIDARSALQPVWQVMNLTIVCQEPWIQVRRAETEAGAAESYLTYADVRAWTWPEEICAVVPEPAAAGRYDPPAQVPVPVLFIQGEADPQNPPENVAEADRRFPHSQVLVAPGQSHQEWTLDFEACLSTITTAFIDSGSAEAVPAECLESVSPPPIRLR